MHSATPPGMITTLSPPRNIFNILDLERELPRSQRAQIAPVIRIALGLACTVYALVGASGYLLLGERVAHYPNILVAFGVNADLNRDGVVSHEEWEALEQIMNEMNMLRGQKGQIGLNQRSRLVSLML